MKRMENFLQGIFEETIGEDFSDLLKDKGPQLESTELNKYKQVHPDIL